MNKLKRFLALFLTMCLMLSCVPFGAMATEPTGTTSTETTAATENATESTTAPVETQTPVETTMPSTEAPVETTVPSTETPVETTVPATEVPVETTVPATEAPVETTVPATETPEETTVPTEPEFEHTAVAYASLRTSYADFYRVFHMDVGRKYFTVDQVKEIIDVLAASGYSHIELAIGNDALRLILDDMSVTVGDTTYAHDDIASGIKAGNVNYSHSGEWTQAEMDTIIAYANGKGIEIIPLVNTPGHMDAILDAMESVGINGAFTTDYYGTSARTVDVTNDEAVAFTQALVNKYIQYFAAKGSTVFHMGADEYANDILVNYTGMGFGYLQNKGYYDEYATYINEMASLIKTAGMIPAAFNDGLYYGSSTSASFDSDILVTYWSSGWTSYEVASASFLANQGHKILNTNDGWYYVLGRATGGYSYESASTNVASTPVTDVPGTDSDIVGAMICLWCDTPSAEYSDSEKSNVVYLLETLAANNTDYFVVETEVPETTEPEPTESEPTVPETSEPATTEPETDEVVQGDVTISADGVTSAVVEELEGFANKPEDVKAYVGYSIVLNDGEYTGAATVKVPYDAALFPGCDTYALIVDGDTFYGNNEAGEPYVAIEGEYFILNVPHFSDVYVVGYSTPVEVSVSVGGTTTVTIEGADVTGTLDTADLDTNTANVSVEKVDVPATDGTEESTVKQTSITSGNTYKIGSNGNYLTFDGTSLGATTNASEATDWTVTSSNYGDGYTISTTYNGTTYYIYRSSSTVTASTQSSTWSFTSQRGFYSGGGDNRRYLTCSNGSWAANNGVDSAYRSFPYTYTAAVPGTNASVNTVITFEGVAVGTTSVVVNGTTYNINVIAEDLSTVEGLTVEFWITNLRVTANNVEEMTIAAADAYGEAGVLISTLIPATGTLDTKNCAFWKATRLASDNKQTLDSGVNKTQSGNDFIYVRYYGGSWAYSNDRKTWTNIADDDQIVAYFMQVTEVTDEVTTQVVDWGELYGNYYNDSDYVLVDYAVKYESGERVPDAFPINGVTQKFHCSDDTNNISYGNVVYDDDAGVYYRNLWSVRAVETSEYEVYMITITPTSDSATTYLSEGADSEATEQSDFYAGTEKVVWVDDEANLGLFADESLHYTSISGDVKYTVGGEPTINELEIYNRHGVLVTYYVRAKATEDALTVHYIDKSAGADNLEFYTYNIAVKEGTFFDENIALNTSNPNGDLLNGTVTNFYNRTQTVSADLSTLSQIGAQYLYSEYECVEVVRSEEGKDVYLYYTFNPTVVFVADFGLPVTISGADLNAELAGIVEDMSFPGVKYTDYGELTDNGTTITYTPTEIMQGADFFTLIVDTSTEVGGILDEEATKIAFRVYVIPANTVYYEEGFVETWSGSWDSQGGKGTGSQEVQLSNAEGLNYGFTNAYVPNTTASAGTQASTTTNAAKAELTFTGTGIEIYANSTTSSSTLAVLLYQNDSLVKFYQVATANKNGTTDATDGQEVTSYNVPVVSIQGLTHGTYKVVLQHTQAKQGAELAIDGFRVFNTTTTQSYYATSEQNSSFVEVRNNVLTGLNVSASGESAYKQGEEIINQVYAEESNLTGAVLLSFNNENIKDLLDNGPKNEVYLQSGDTITFNLAAAAQVGLKALTGSTTYTLNGEAATLNTTVDMFYDLPAGNVTIQNTGNGVLALTKFKGAELTALTAETVGYALMRMNYEEIGDEDTTPTEPEDTTPTEPEVEDTTPTEPEVPEVVYADASVSVNVVDYAGNSVATAALTANGVAGEACTFTAQDILDAVKAVLPAGYAVADETSVSDLEMTYGSVASTTVKVGKVATLNITYKRLFGRSTETVTLTVVQTSAASGYTFTAREIRGAIPAARIAVWMRNVRVNFGSAKNIFVPIF